MEVPLFTRNLMNCLKMLFAAGMSVINTGNGEVYSCGHCTHVLCVPYILESNPHPFYSFRGLKNRMRIRIACGLDSRS